MFADELGEALDGECVKIDGTLCYATLEDWVVTFNEDIEIDLNDVAKTELFKHHMTVHVRSNENPFVIEILRPTEIKGLY